MSSTPIPEPGAPDAPVCLVTGSARGIGLAVARELGSRGMRVHVVVRSSDAGPLESEFPTRVHRADLVQPDAAADLVRAVVEQDGRLDVVVHAVGEYWAGSLEALDAATFQRLQASNSTSAFYLAEAVREPLRAAAGALVFFGAAGIESLRARRTSAAYIAAKTGLLVLMRSLAIEEAEHGVRVNMVSPGVIPHAAASEDTRAASRLAEIPLGRVGEPSDVAAAVAWLVSPGAAYVTGQNLDVSGGWLL